MNGSEKWAVDRSAPDQGAGSGASKEHHGEAFERVRQDVRSLQQRLRQGAEAVAVTESSIAATHLDIAERALAACDIIVNRNAIAGDRYGPQVTSGVRFGTNVLAVRGMGEPEMSVCATLVDWVLTHVRPRGERDYTMAEPVRAAVRAEVDGLCRRYPLPGGIVSPDVTALVREPVSAAAPVGPTSRYLT